MPTCPKFSNSYPLDSPICPTCRYDFPFATKPAANLKPRYSGHYESNESIAYGGLADFALTVGMVISVLQMLASLIYGVIALLSSRWLHALIGAPLSFFLAFALFVVFRRVADLNEP